MGDRGQSIANTRSADFANAILNFTPPVLRRCADSPALHQILVRAKTAAELASINIINIYSLAL